MVGVFQGVIVQRGQFILGGSCPESNCPRWKYFHQKTTCKVKKKAKKKKKLEKTVKCSKLKNKVVLMSLLITLNIFHIIFSVSIIDFEQVSVC